MAAGCSRFPRGSLLTPGRGTRSRAWARRFWPRQSLIAWPHALPALARWTDAACLLQALTGLPCPGCGITTSLLALGRGDVAASWAANPAGLAVAGLLVRAGAGGRGGLADADVGGKVPAIVGLRWLSRLDRVALGGLLAAWIARLFGVVS